MMRDLSFALGGGVLELRAAPDGGAQLSGSFPYSERAVLSDGGRNGRPEKEEFAPNAFEFRVSDPTAEIHLLAGHRYDQPLASRGAGTLTLRDTVAALLFEATITAEVAATTHARDVLLLLGAELATGISPGFRMPPKRAVPAKAAEEFIDEPVDPEAGQYGARIRVIKQALLYELSVVTMPAYPKAKVKVKKRALELVERPPLLSARSRWRA